MRHWFVFAPLLVLITSPVCSTHALSAPLGPTQTLNASPEVPQDDKAYSCVDELQKAGIVIGYPDGTYGSGPRMTEYQFGIAVARLFPVLLYAGVPRSDDLVAMKRDLSQKLAQSVYRKAERLPTMSAWKTVNPIRLT